MPRRGVLMQEAGRTRTFILLTGFLRYFLGKDLEVFQYSHICFLSEPSIKLKAVERKERDSERDREKLYGVIYG